MAVTVKVVPEGRKGEKKANKQMNLGKKKKGEERRRKYGLVQRKG
jgi:hypothetical protein